MTTRLIVVALAAALLASTAAGEEQTRSPADSASFDARTPLPLTAPMAEHQKRNMREHLVAVRKIVAALAEDDLAAAATAARSIGHSEFMARMCRHMGAGADGFTEMALAFHRTADTVASAAERGDARAATRALGETLATCVTCHAAWRQQVVTPAEWERLSSEGGRSPAE